LKLHFQTIRAEHKDGVTQLYWNNSPYHQDKLFPLLEEAISTNEFIELIVIKNEKTELNMFFVKPDYERITSFILSFPRVKLYKSFYYFINSII
jgi:hypothetical protein